MQQSGASSLNSSNILWLLFLWFSEHISSVLCGKTVVTSVIIGVKMNQVISSPSNTTPKIQHNNQRFNSIPLSSNSQPSICIFMRAYQFIKPTFFPFSLIAVLNFKRPSCKRQFYITIKRISEGVG
jgi:hypothetical protein